MAFARNTIPEQQTIRNMERGENFAYLWNGFLIVLLGFFIPTPLFIALLVTYAIAGAVLKVYRKEVREALFKFFDNVASFFGYPPPPEPLATQEQTHVDRGFIQRRLRSYSDPAISDGNREAVHAQFYGEPRQRQRMFVQPQNIIQIPLEQLQDARLTSQSLKGG